MDGTATKLPMQDLQYSQAVAIDETNILLGPVALQALVGLQPDSVGRTLVLALALQDLEEDVFQFIACQVVFQEEQRLLCQLRLDKIG